MLRKRDGESWFFVDESGDTEFYDSKRNIVIDKQSWNPIFLLGFVETQKPDFLRKALLALRNDIRSDPKLQDIASLNSSLNSFHAAKDHRKIRELVFSLLPQLDFRAEFVLVRKQNLLEEFRRRYNSNGNAIYDQMVSMLFGNVLHRYSHNRIFYEVRRQRPRQIHFHSAIEYAIGEFEKKQKRAIGCSFDVTAQRSVHEPCLSIIDYMNWAIQRAFVSGEMSYYRIVENKVSLLLDLYHPTHPEGRIFYSRKNPLTESTLEPIKNRAQVASFI